MSEPRRRKFGVPVVNKRFIIHLIRTLIFCNGMASSLCTVLILMFMMFTGSGKITAVTGITYTVMAVYAGRLASKGLPASAAARYIPAAIPAAVTIAVWIFCLALAGGSFAADESAFDLYAASQFTHFAVISVCKAGGAYLQAFLLPLFFNLIFLISFTAFERKGKERTG